jgi:putative hydrolase of HD superfamily
MEYCIAGITYQRDETMDNERLEKQLSFIVEIDKLKRIVRQTILTDRSRQENDAEHSWHMAVMALLLSEYANENHIDLFRVIKMILIHDLVEIDAGDTYCYDEHGRKDQREREEKAALRVFSILPDDQASEVLNLWHEFEDRATPEARFAAALDRLQPLLNNFATEGAMWQKNGIHREQVLERNSVIDEGAAALWKYAESMIRDAVEKGYLTE